MQIMKTQSIKINTIGNNFATPTVGTPGLFKLDKQRLNNSLLNIRSCTVINLALKLAQV